MTSITPLSSSTTLETISFKETYDEKIKNFVDYLSDQLTNKGYKVYKNCYSDSYQICILNVNNDIDTYEIRYRNNSSKRMWIFDEKEFDCKSATSNEYSVFADYIINKIYLDQKPTSCTII